MIIYRHTHRARIQCDGEAEHESRTFAPCRGGFYTRRIPSVRVGHAFEKYFFISYVFVEVSFLALEVTYCPFINVFGIWIVNGVDCDIRG